MRHRAPRHLAPPRVATASRRKATLGVVVLLGACTGVGLLVTDDPSHTGGGLVEAGSARAGGNGYPGAVALETAREARASQATRGRGRTSPAAPVSSPPGPLIPGSPAGPTRPVRSAPLPVGTERPDASQAAEPPSAEPPSGTSESGTPTPGGPSADLSTSPPQPQASTSSPGTGGTAPAPPPAPETTAVTDVSAAGTWTVVITSDRTATFECSLDGAAFAPCAPVANFVGLSQGRHTLAVRAVDASGVTDPTPATLATTVAGPLP